MSERRVFEGRSDYQPGGVWGLYGDGSIQFTATTLLNLFGEQRGKRIRITVEVLDDRKEGADGS